MHSGVLLNSKEWNYVICRKTGGTGDHHGKWNKPDSDKNRDFPESVESKNVCHKSRRYYLQKEGNKGEGGMREDSRGDDKSKYMHIWKYYIVTQYFVKLIYANEIF